MPQLGRIVAKASNIWRCSLVVIALLLALWPLASSHAAIGPITTVATFHPDQVPENLVFDHRGNIYINMATSGEILRIAPDGTQSTLARLSTGPNGVFLGLEVDGQDNIYANLDSHNAPGTDTQGVWRIHPDGSKELFAATDPAGNLNQGIFDTHGDLLVPDSILGLIYRITPGGQVSTWLSDPLLQPDQAACGGYPHPGGVNDLALDSHGNLYTDNTNRGLVIRVPVKPDGRAGTASVVASGCATLHGADGITLDSEDNIYVAVNIQNRVIRIHPDGTIETLASGADGLDDPSGLALGGARGEPSELYIVSYALFTPNGSKHPSLMKLDVGVSGVPLIGVPELATSASGVSASFTVSFASTSPGQGEVFFGSGPGCTGLVEVATQDRGAGTTVHTVVVRGNDLPGTVGDNGLIPGATYSYVLVTVTKSGMEVTSDGGTCYSVTIPNV